MRVWTQRALLLGLAPVLAAQGRHVRRVIPVLPEPSGPRAGQLGSGKPLRLLIAGDSAGAGVGVDHQQDALSGQLATALASRFTLDWQLVAQTGYTTADLVKRLGQEPPRAFDVAVLSLGVNDVIGAVPSALWLFQQNRLMRLLRGRFQVRHVFATCLPPMERFTALPQPLRAVLGARVRRFNAALSHRATGWPACTLIRFDLENGTLDLARDGFHPGRETYGAWAAQVADAITRWADAQP